MAAFAGGGFSGDGAVDAKVPGCLGFRLRVN